MYLSIKLFESVKKKGKGLCSLNLRYNYHHFTENALTVTMQNLYIQISEVSSHPNSSWENVLQSKDLNLRFTLLNLNTRHNLSESNQDDNSNNNNNKSSLLKILKSIPLGQSAQQANMLLKDSTLCEITW